MMGIVCGFAGVAIFFFVAEIKIAEARCNGDCTDRFLVNICWVHRLRACATGWLLWGEK